MKGYRVWNFPKHGTEGTYAMATPPTCPYWVHILVNHNEYRLTNLIHFSPEISGIISTYEYPLVRVIQAKDTGRYFFHFNYDKGLNVRFQSRARAIVTSKTLVNFVLDAIPSADVVAQELKACEAARKTFACFIAMDENISETDDEAICEFTDLIKICS